MQIINDYKTKLKQGQFFGLTKLQKITKTLIYYCGFREINHHIRAITTTAAITHQYHSI